MHSQKIMISGGSMVEKNQFFPDPGPSNQSELVHHTAFHCVQFSH